jgi:hypothetical protein
LAFANDICKEAAAYFQPLSASRAADAIAKISGDHLYREQLVENGYNRLKFFLGPEEQHCMTGNGF